MNIDASFKELEGLIARMEASNQSIEEAMNDYQKGMQLIKDLRMDLTEVEKKIQKLNIETGELSEE